MWQTIRRGVKRIVRPPFINYIDVGAAGRLQHPWKQHQGKINHWLRFEPTEKGIKRVGTQISMDAAIWHQKETLEFYVMGEYERGSSLLLPNPDFVRENFEELKQHGDPEMAASWFERSQIREQHTINTRSLDDVLDELNQHNIYHFLKTDVQGADCYVFKGAEELLKSSCIGIQTEQFIYPLYQDSILLDETTEYLAQFGFELVKKFPPHGTFHSQHDCLYLKTGVENRISKTIRSMYGID